MAVHLKAAKKARAFDLKDVTVTGGPFKHAMDLNKAYLLQLEPDRLLARFREYAGLEPKAPQYEGWESMSLSGHTLGHYMSACAMMCAALGDDSFKERTDYIVDELEICQNAHGDGYVSAIPRGKEMFLEVSSGDIRSKGFDLNGAWAPLYTIHKLLAGLRDSFRLAGNPKALGVAVKLSDWLARIFAPLTDEQMEQMMLCEYGGMNEVLADLYADTGNEAYLKLAERFWHKLVLDPLADKTDCLPGKHANTQIPKLIGLAKQYELTNDARRKETAEFFWERVVRHHSYVIGGNSFGEYFGEPDTLNDRIGPHTTETCNTYNMLKLTRHLFEWNASALEADYFERALFNHILASQDPKEGGVCYYVSLAMGGRKDYNNKFEDFTCCVGTGMENHANYGSGIYFHQEDRLFVNQFIPSVLRWNDKQVTVTQETNYPEEDTISLQVNCGAPAAFTLCVRYPSWAPVEGVSVKVNEEAVEVHAHPGSFIEINRVWMDGDRVRVAIPMELRLESMPDNPNRIAVMYGPLVLAGELGPLDDPDAKSHLFTPVMIVKHKPLSEWLEPIPGRTATFRTKGAGHPRDITLYPFYRMHDKLYSVYFDLFTPEEWAQAEIQYRRARERLLLLENCTIDYAQPGEMQPERDHNFQGDVTRVDELYNRPCRVAGMDGWFSFDMKVQPGVETLLVATYTSAKEMNNIGFDVIVGGMKVEEVAGGFRESDVFYNVNYPVPGDTAAKDDGTVAFEFKAYPGHRVRRVFGLRTVNKKEYEKLGLSLKNDAEVSGS
ncbi:glycoside hydrolase family 127 protein [Paenibacillus alkalitolerans]|uniref:glycoside hydrolase family 127 protein n=1 Tax=Paenibacillus alkalitolerans TaxID=2799335 RepID=UPI0018F551C3|nr:glycoside hydrolase family 127 protein [Paenibacillus alkalitolerans]